MFVKKMCAPMSLIITHKYQHDPCKAIDEVMSHTHPGLGPSLAEPGHANVNLNQGALDTDAPLRTHTDRE